MRVSSNKINSTLKNRLIKTLAQLLADFKKNEDAETFLRDFFNENELETFAKRLSIAYWLKKGRSYTNIMQNLKVSSATIASVEKIMKKEGFKLAIKNLEAEEWANQWAEKIQKFVGSPRK